MSYTPIQLEAIRIFGKKDLTEGCTIYCDTYEWDKYIVIDKWNITDATSAKYGIFLKSKYWNWKCTYPFEILWHEPHLEDVFRVVRNSWHSIWLNDDAIEFDEDFLIEYSPTLPLLEQSESTLTQLCNLFK